MKGLKKIWKASVIEIMLFAAASFGAAYVIARPYIAKRTIGLQNRKKDIYRLFDLPLIIGAALLSFAHGANDVANAVGPLAAIVSTMGGSEEIAKSVSIPVWVMVVGAFGIALGLGLYGPKLIAVVGEKITRLNSPRAYCVALSAAGDGIDCNVVGPAGQLNPHRRGCGIRCWLSAGVFGKSESQKIASRSQAQRKPLLKHSPVRSIAKSGGLCAVVFVLSIAAAWVITVPASAMLAATIYAVLQIF